MDPYEPRNFGRSGNGPQQTPSNYTIIASSQDQQQLASQYQQVAGETKLTADDNQRQWEQFLEKVLQQKKDPDPWHLRDLEDCQLKLESLFDVHFMPGRDFTDFIAEKKERCFEECKAPPKRSGDKKDSGESGQDQDSQVPMELDPEAYRGLEESKEESKSQEGRYFAKCKKIGRIGPKVCRLNKKSQYGEALFYGRDELEIEAISSFYSVRANVGVFSGRYYFEVMLKTSGLMQIGWCSLQTTFSSQNGVGDDPSSYAYDGMRVKKWNRDNLGYGEAWTIGDIIGTLIDFDRKVISFWRNGRNLGNAFTNIRTGPNCVYFPAISAKQGQRVVFNFGVNHLSVQHARNYALLQEPDAEVHNSRRVAFQIIEYLKTYLVKFGEYPMLPVDRKLTVGSLLVEYLYPLIMDEYLLEEQLLQFLFEVTMIGQASFRNLIFDLFILHLSPEQLKVFIGKLMKCLTKRILNTPLLASAGSKKPGKQEFDMTYFRLLMDLIEREEFLYAWLCSDTFFNDLECVFEVHVPSQTDLDDFFSPAYHEYLLGSADHRERFLKNSTKAQSAIAFTQTYLFKLTQILMSRKKLVITSSDIKRAPFDRFRDFLHHVACRATKKPREDDLAHRPHQPGMNNNMMLTNVFVCFASQMDTFLTSPQKGIYCFPYHCLFMRDGYDFDESLRKMDRIGGSFTHLEAELSDHLQPFRGIPIGEEASETFMFAKDLLLILIHGILPEIESYTLSLDQMYMHHRRLMDLTDAGKIEKSSEITNELSKILRTKLGHWRLGLQNAYTREMLLKFSLWLLQLVNHIDNTIPDLIYILPDYLVAIPFEILRMLKRESCLIVSSGMTLCTQPTGPNAEARQNVALANEEALESYKLLLSEEMRHMNANARRDTENRFYVEMVAFIARHFMDDRIANPDLKEHYLIRVNTLLQHNQFIKAFEQNQYAQQNLVPMLFRSFQKGINLRHASKNILRLAKGQGFREIVYEENIEKTNSAFFLQRLRQQLLAAENKDTARFMNSFFNALNDITSELCIIFKELKESVGTHPQALRRTQHHFYAVIDLLRICELFTTWCPELFLDVEQVHSNRLMSFVMFVLNIVFVGQMDRHIDYFAQKMFCHSATLDQFLSPIIGIVSALYTGITRLQDVEAAKYESIESLFARNNGLSDSVLIQFNALYSVVEDAAGGQLKGTDHGVMERFSAFCAEFEGVVREAEAKNMAAAMARAESGEAPVVMGGQIINEDDFADEDLCTLCYTVKADTVFVPCEHTTCKKCIQTHMLNAEKCPFCNSEIKELRKVVRK